MQDDQGRGPLHFVNSSNRGSAKVLLTLGANPNLRDLEGRSLLHAAAYDGDTNLIETIVKMAGDLELKDADGHTALQIAAINGQLEAVKRLISMRADPRPIDALALAG